MLCSHNDSSHFAGGRRRPADPAGASRQRAATSAPRVDAAVVLPSHTFRMIRSPQSGGTVAAAGKHIGGRESANVAALECEIRVTGPVATGMLDVLADLQAFTQSVETVPRVRARPSCADRHHPPVAGFGSRTAWSPTPLNRRSLVDERSGKGAGRKEVRCRRRDPGGGPDQTRGGVQHARIHLRRGAHGADPGRHRGSPGRSAQRHRSVDCARARTDRPPEQPA